MEDRTVFQPSAGGSVRPGVRLNGIYEIERLIAQGGMGEVYRGFNIQTRDTVAIKMIRPELSSNPDVFDLFRREASILHTLQHEAIVRYFVFSVDPDLRRAYLAMEFVDGPSLTERLASGPLPLADVKILQKRIGSALDTAHRLGVVHRDISSDNVILPDNDVRSAKIIDFGIARSHRPGEGTIIGDGFAGKYNYVSPEQLGLAGGDVTLKSDIYSFGLVLAEALRGRPIEMSGSQADVIEKRRAVPDLADIDPSIRPLIEAMLQPLPANRPESMAAVAAWEAPGRAGLVLPRAGAGKTAPSRKSSGGRAAAILGALIALGSLGGAVYVFRDDLGQWGQSVFGPPPPVISPIKPSPIGPTAQKPASQQQATTEASKPPPQAALPTGQAAAPPNPAPSPGEPANPPAKHVPTSAELVDAMPPHAPQASVDLPPATVGALYRADLPAFTDQGGKGLRLAAASAPEGMAFKDLGGGKGEIAGTPTRPGNAAIEVVATNHNGMTAQMTARIDISGRAQTVSPTAPPTASSPSVPPAQTEEPPHASVPHAPQAEPAPPSPPLAALPHLPPLAPAPAPAIAPPTPAAQPEIAPQSPPTPAPQVATAPQARASVASRACATSRDAPAVAPQAPPPPAPQVATAPAVSPQAPPPPAAAPTSPPPNQQLSALEPTPALSPIDKAKAFVSGFDGGDCFLVKPLSGSSDPNAYLAIGRELQPFERFNAAYTSKVGAEPQLSVRLITPSECPAIDLMRLGSAAGASAPHIELENYSVARGAPLKGTIANLDGRHLFLVLVGDDGVAYRLEAKPIPGRDAATFDVSLTPDASSIGPMQILLAIVSAKPIPALESFRSGPLSSIKAQLASNARDGAMSVGADFFKFAD